MSQKLNARLQIRQLVQSKAYAELNRYYDALESQWFDSENSSHPYFDLTNAGTLFDYNRLPFAECADFLKNWIAACPEAYHPHLIWGGFCFGRATDIRGYDSADAVNDDQWLGAALACENAFAALLAAVARSTRPVSAGKNLLQLSSHFQESAWLIDLFNGVPPRQTLRHTVDDPALLEQAVAHLARFGLTALEQAPQALPTLLPPRDAHDQDQGEDYWLHQALQWRPACLEVLLAYAHYLRPRWGGSYEDIDGLANGPLAAGLSEAERNSIRWIGVYDNLNDYPDADEVGAVQEFKRRFESWLARDLLPSDRGDALGRFAQFCSHSLADHARSYQLHVQSVAAFPDEEYRREAEGPFHSFVYVALSQHQLDDSGAFKQAIERLCRFDEESTPLAIAAVGHEHGLWGFEQDPARAEKLYARVIELAPLQLDAGFTVFDFAINLWKIDAHDLSYQLFSRLASHHVLGASDHLYDIHRGFHDDTPENFLNDAKREFWLMRAVEDGSPLAKYNLAWRKIFTDDVDFSQRANVDAVRQLLEDSRAEPRCDAFARLRIGVLLRDYGSPREQEEAVECYLRSLIDDADDWASARACAEIALAYMHGRGTKRSRFAAIEWVQHATRLLPDNEGIDEIHAEVLNSHSLIKTVATVIGAFLTRGSAKAEDLPPKPAQ